MERIYCYVIYALLSYWISSDMYIAFSHVTANIYLLSLCLVYIYIYICSLNCAELTSTSENINWMQNALYACCFNTFAII